MKTTLTICRTTIRTSVLVVVLTIFGLSSLPIQAQTVNNPNVQTQGGFGTNRGSDNNFGDTNNPTNELTQQTLDDLNPLMQQGDPALANQFSTPGGVISRVLQFAFPVAGLILFVMLVWAGFEILGGATEKKSLDAGRQRATAAVVGFMLLFASYWFIQILQVVFGVKIF